MDRRIEIAVIAPSVPEEFFDLLWEGVRSAAYELASFGVTVHTCTTTVHDPAAQGTILSGLLDSRFSALALVPAHPSNLDALIAQHASQGRPVVTFHNDAPGSERYSFVGTSAPEAGALAAEALGKFMGFRGQIAAFPGDLAQEQFAQRHRGFQQELEQWSGSLQEVICHRGLEDLPAALERAFQDHAYLTGIYVGCARTHLVAEACKRMRLAVPFVGFDNTPAVRPYLADGTVWAVIDESVHQQGYIAVQRAYEICVSQAANPTRWVRVPSTLVLASNSSEGRIGESLNEAFEQLIRQQTAQLRSYRQMLESANDNLVRLAETDALTGLLNRRKFEEILPLELKRARDCGHASILMVDVDRFKNYNDSHGHHVGDEALRAVARVLVTAARATDFCARLGGDEFCIVLPGADRATANELRERICEMLKMTSVISGGPPLFISASIGSATFPEDGTTHDELVIAADRSMYAEKRKTRLTPDEIAV